MSNTDCVKFTLKLLDDDLTLLDKQDGIQYYCDPVFIYSNLELDITACYIEDSIILDKHYINTWCEGEEINIKDITEWDYTFFAPSNYVLDEIFFTEINLKDKI